MFEDRRAHANKESGEVSHTTVVSDTWATGRPFPTRATKTNPPPRQETTTHADNVRYGSLLTTGFGAKATVRRVPLSRTCVPGPGLRFGQSKMNGRMWATNKTRRGRFHIRQTRTADTRRCQCNIRQYKYPVGRSSLLQPGLCWLQRQLLSC